MIRRLFQYPWRSHAVIRSDVDDELRFHLDSRQQALMATGLSVDAARARAIREFGDIDEARRYMQHVDNDIETNRRRKDYVRDVMYDLKYALRSLRVSPTFTIVAVLTLAIGIGANTAVFSVVHGVLRQPLPFPNPERLVRVWSANRSGDSPKASVSAVDLDDWRAQRRQFEDIGGWEFASGASGLDLTGSGQPQRVSTAFVSPGFFTTLGVGALHGRLPYESEMVRGGDDRVVVLSFPYWQRNFGASTTVLNTTLILRGEPYRVVGVMPPNFRFPSPSVEIYVPFSTIPDQSIPRIRPVRIMGVVARLKPNVTLDQARAEMNVITGRLAAQYPENATWTHATVLPLHEAITGSVQNALLVLFAAVTGVLLMACVNVASLVLTRASAREREIGVRVALGATRGRILRQLVTESMVLALAGGVLGIGVAVVGTRVLLALSAGQLPLSEAVGVNPTVLLFALGASLFAGILFGAAPALRASSTNLQGALRAGGRTSTGASTRLRSALVIAQVAFAVVLAVGAGLTTRSFNALLHVDPGFTPDHLLAVNFTINTDRHGDTAWKQYYSDVITRVRAVPGVTSAGAAQYAPFKGMGERNALVPVGYVARPGEEPPAFPTQRISDAYFRTIGTRILSGREFLPTDRGNAPPVVVVNEAYAKAFFPGQNAVGKELTVGGSGRLTIVGVVGDIRQSDVAEAPGPLLYVSNLQNGRVKVTLVCRTVADPLTMTRSIRDAIWSVDRDQPITSIFTFNDIMQETLARPRLVTVLFAAFGVLGLTLGALGIYGVLAFLVTQRRREIGVRIALGANARRVYAMIMRHGVGMAIAGLVIGISAALALSRFVQSLLFGIPATDPYSYAGVVLLFLFVATLAGLLPARRAMRVDPVIAMQQE
ncbi:MAG: ABC transporter permease [Gemmatimonadota bacterium]